MTITVNENITPTFTAVAAICSGASLSALPTTSINGITGTWSPAINATTTTEYTFTPSAGQCATTVTMTITVNILPTAPIATAQSFCNSGTVAGLAASGTALKWYSSANEVTALDASTALETETFFVSQTLNACESPRTSVEVTINTTASPTIASGQVFNSNTVLSDLNVIGIGIVWYSSSEDAISNTAPLASSTTLVSGNTYYAMQTIDGCSSLTPLAFEVTNNLDNVNFDTVGFEYYPNPVINDLNLSYSKNMKIVKVFNLIGQELLIKIINAKTAQIDLSRYVNGPYFIQVITENAIKTIKVIKK